MARNRRNVRSRNRALELLTNRRFIIISSILLAIILCIFTFFIVSNQIKKAKLQKEQENIKAQQQDIFDLMKQEIASTNEFESDSVIRLSVTGDIFCNDKLIQNSTIFGKYQFSSILDHVKSYLNDSNITIGTLNTQFLDEKINGSSKNNSPKEFATEIKNTGYNILGLAQGNVLDYGSDGITNTSKYLKEELQIDSIGTNTLEDTSENRVTMKEVRNARIAIVGYTLDDENIKKKSAQEQSMVMTYNEERVSEDLLYAKQNAEFTIVCINWNEIRSKEVTNKQKEVVDYLISQGANMILGSNTRVMQDMEIRKNEFEQDVFVSYGLGDFIPKAKDKTIWIKQNKKSIAKVVESAEYNTSLILNIQLKRSAQDGSVSLKKVDYVPVCFYDKGPEENRVKEDQIEQNIETKMKADYLGRYKIIDLKKEVLSFSYQSEENKSIVSKNIYDQFVVKLNEVNEQFKKESEE